MTSVAVGLGGLGAGRQAGRVEAQAHRAALLLHVPLVGHEVDHRGVGEEVELGRVGVLRTDHVAGELDDAALEAQAQAQVGHLPLARVAGGQHLALDAAMAEAARHEHAGHAREVLGVVLRA